MVGAPPQVAADGRSRRARLGAFVLRDSETLDDRGGVGSEVFVALPDEVRASCRAGGGQQKGQIAVQGGRGRKWRLEKRVAVLAEDHGKRGLRGVAETRLPRLRHPEKGGPVSFDELVKKRLVQAAS